MADAAAALKLGTRGSQLALWQANAVAERLQATAGRSCQIIVIKTSGDRLQDAPLSEVGGKRLFVKEIEDALLRGEIDAAVHSSKDIPAMLPSGLTIGAVLPRENPLDAFVLPQAVRAEAVRLKPDTTYGTGRDITNVVSGFSRTSDSSSFEEMVARLGESPVIGTSSVRRIAQLTRLFPKARFMPIRGNLDTRLRKLDAGEYDALVLAAAGLQRLGLASRISARTPASVCVPAPGQGIVAIEIRDKDLHVRETIRLIDDAGSHAALDAERAVVETLGGGCQTPIGALATRLSNDQLELVAIVISLDGSEAITALGRGNQVEAAAIGASVGAQLIERGAGRILAEADQARGAVEGIQP